MQRLLSRMGVLGRFFQFLWQEKLWWMIPMVIMLVVLGAVVLFSQSSAVAPFIYTLF